MFVALLWLLKLHVFTGHDNHRISWLILYCFGYYYAKVGNIYKKVASVFVGIGLLYLISDFTWEKLLDYYSIYCIAIHVCGAISIFLFFIFLFSRFRYAQTYPWLKFFDRYSFHIYIVHHIIIMQPFSLLFISANLYLNILFVLLYIGIFSFILATISDKMESYLVENCSILR